MIGTTHVWETTQAIKMAGHTGDAIAPALGSYDPAKLLGLVQSHAELYRQTMEAALADFWSSFKSPFKYDKTCDDWELVKPEGEDWRQWPVDPTATGPGVRIEWDPIHIPELFEEVSFIREVDGGFVSGLKMWQRALDPAECNCPDGQFLAEWLLLHQQYIPKSWRGHYLVFPGTVWRSRDGALDVAYLGWSDGRWCLDFGWLDDGWDGYDRLLRRRDS
ncbi:MAG: hypothetical protein Q7S64_01470 [bacterium]|nr:hypothetical protein [bacterium]